MSRLTDLIAQAKAKDAELGKELEREFKTLASQTLFAHSLLKRERKVK